MSQMSPGQARVVDPILSQHARGYRQADLVARMLFPIAFVTSYGGKVIEFGKEAFRLHNSKRAPGSSTKRIQLGYEGKPYAIVPSALDAVTPRELLRDASQVPGIDLASRGVNTVLRSLNLEHEYECAQIARNAANYDADHKVALVGADRWTSPDSTPVEDIEVGKEAVRGSIGMYPNTLLLSAKARSALRTHPDLIGRTANAATRIVTDQLLMDVFGVARILTGSATVATGATDALSDVWGLDAVLAYVSPGSEVQANNEEPSYGYTYTIEGMPLVETPYWDNGSKSWIHGVSFDNTPVLSGMTAGYLIQNAGAPAA